MHLLKSIPLMQMAGRHAGRGLVELELAMNRKFGFDNVEIRVMRDQLEIVVWRPTRSRKVRRVYPILAMESLRPCAIPSIVEGLASELW